MGYNWCRQFLNGEARMPAAINDNIRWVDRPVLSRRKHSMLKFAGLGLIAGAIMVVLLELALHFTIAHP